MTEKLSLIYPMFAMVLLTFIVLLALFRSRSRSVRDGTISASFFSIYQGQKEPDTSVKLSRHFANIFEVPTLFYAACLSAMIVGQNAIAFHALAWAYVVLRVVHAYIHTGSNRILPRVYAYFSSWGVLLTMWVYLVIGVATA